MQSFSQSPPAQQMQGFVSDVTSVDLSSHLGLVASSGQVSVSFEYAHERIDDPSNPSINGTHRVQLYARIRPHGDRFTEARRRMSESQAAQMFPREYAWFKQTDTVVTNGTPLHELPGVSQSQIAVLVIHNIRCVEDLAALSPDHIGQIGPDARMAYNIAVRWVAAKTENTDMIAKAGDQAAKDILLERLQRETSDKDAAIARLSAQVDILSRSAAASSQSVNQALPPDSSSAPLVAQVDADDLPETVQSDFMAGGGTVVGNDDLDAAPPKVQLPDLDRRKK